ncbi:MAG TPA: PAS domain S-box protein, partial [Albitalea sp.]
MPQPVDEEPALWDMLPAMALRLGADGELLQVNRGFAKRLPQAAQALGTAWLDGLAPPSRAALLQALARRADFGMQLRSAPEAGARCFDLQVRWLEAPGQYVGLLHDVSDLKQAETTARARAELLRLLSDNVPALIAYYDATTLRCRFANERYARTFGWDSSSILGHTVAEVIGADAAGIIEPQVQRVLQQVQSVAYERELDTPEGRRHLEVHLLPHVGEQGQPVGCFVLISDITKFRRAQDAMRESEERLSKFMQASCEGIVFHKDGFITDANPPLLQLVGYTLEEILGRKTLEFIAPDHVAKVASVIASGQETAYESMLLDKHGQRIPVEFIVRTMLRNGERMRMTIVRDLRDRHAAQARIHHLAHHDTLTG